MSSRSCRRELGSAGRRSCPTLPSGGCPGEGAQACALPVRPFAGTVQPFRRAGRAALDPDRPVEEHRVRDLVPRIRPARPASSWWSPSTSITSRGWPPAPRTWWRGSVRHGRRAPGGAVDLDHAQGMATGAGGAEDLVAWIRPARPASSFSETARSCFGGRPATRPR